MRPRSVSPGVDKSAAKETKRVANKPVASPPADQSLNDLSLEYQYHELVEATENFDNTTQVGSGTYGGVFRGLLKDGTEVAVKVLELPDEAGFEEEVKVLSRFRHPNLVILMGFSRNDCQRCLVYEMLSGGDLHKRLQRSCQDLEAFPWKSRLSIALDASCGLSHLHHARPKVFHRDIKSANILLDRNGLAKMADFGLACLSHSEQHRVKQCSGTVGYACPLYVQRGVVTEGSEVYSFGMVLFELLTSSPPAYIGGGGDNGRQEIKYLVNHINADVNKALALSDPKAGWLSEISQEVATLAVTCTDMREERRPGFGDIVRNLRAVQERGSSLDVCYSTSPAPQPAAQNAAAPIQKSSTAQSRAVPQARPAVVLPGASKPVQPGGLTPSLAAQAQQQQHSVAGATHPQRMHPSASHLGGSPSTPSAAHAMSRLSQGGAQAQSLRTRTPSVVLPSSAGYPQRQGVVRGAGVTNGQVSALSLASHASTSVAGGTPSVRVPMSQQQHQMQRVQSESRSGTHQASRGHVVHSMATMQSRFSARREGRGRPRDEDMPVLFALECIFSEGADLHDIPAEDRTMTHSLAPEERFQFPLPPLRVGRGFQAAFFDQVVIDMAARSTISREHFQIWAEEALERGGGAARSPQNQSDAVPVIFFIANLSGNGTSVNDRCLQGRGEQCVLHDGDIITLSRDVPNHEGASQTKFLQFHFDISVSCLREANHSEMRDSMPMVTPRHPSYTEQQQQQQVSPQQHTPSQMLRRQSSPHKYTPPPATEEEWNGIAIGEAEMTSMGSGREFVFVLRVEGPVVFDHVPHADRFLAYAPPPEDDPSLLYSSMIVGRAHQLAFWERVIHAHAFDTMSRQHFEIQTWRNDSKYSFVVRNLSDVNPIRIQGGGGGKDDDVSLAFGRDEQRHLLDGDRIIMNWGQEHVFWFSFNDLTRSTRLSMDGDDNIGSGYTTTSSLGSSLRMRRSVSNSTPAAVKASGTPTSTLAGSGAGGVGNPRMGVTQGTNSRVMLARQEETLFPQPR